MTFVDEISKEGKVDTLVDVLDVEQFLKSVPIVTEVDSLLD